MLISTQLRAGSSWNRGRGKSKQSLALIDAVSVILEQIQPTSIRSICYQLFVRKLTSDMSVKYTGKISKQLVWAREHGLIPWAWIVDETRAAERISRIRGGDPIIASISISNSS